MGCRANTLECQACIADVSEEEFCRRKPHSHVCPKKPTKPSHPHNCYSKDLKKEVMMGEMGARNCCWYGDWKSKSKCEKKPSHRDNCYSSIWNTEISHGEMGAKKCCWYGKWEKSPSARRTHQSLILITATPLSGTPKSGMVRWAQESAAGTESWRRSPSARRNHQSLILITATPLSGTLKSGMVRWAPRSAAGTVTGRKVQVREEPTSHSS